MSNGLVKREIKMPTQYEPTTSKADNVEVNGFTIVKREDGNYAIPGGGHVSNLGYARQIARRLSYENPKAKSPVSKLADKVVTRLNGASREGVDLVLGV